MKCLGKVAHLDIKNRAIVITTKKVEKNTKVFDAESNLVGRVVNIFGPVNQPYLAISAKTSLGESPSISIEIRPFFDVYVTFISFSNLRYSLR